MGAVGAGLLADKGTGALIRGARWGHGRWVEIHPCAHLSFAAHGSFQGALGPKYIFSVAKSSFIVLHMEII